MKYIKLFEDLYVGGKDNDVVPSEWLGKLLSSPSTKKHKFSDSEFNRIKDLFYSTEYDCVNESSGLEISNDDNSLILFIYKLDDEWFFINKFMDRYCFIRKDWYKCDQIDGLIDCIKKEILQ